MKYVLIWLYWGQSMKKYKKGIFITVSIILLSIVSVSAMFFYQLKATSEKIYSPMETEHAVIRVDPITIEQQRPISVLLLGVDERDGDKGRSDTMIVLTINPNTQTTKMLSIPRDTLTEMNNKGFQDKINHAFAYGGAPLATTTVEAFLDIPIDYVVVINMESFVQIIDVVGDVTIDNPFTFEYDGQTFKEGSLTLDGQSALKYVRMRYEDPQGDFGRQNRQKQIIQAILQNSKQLNILLNANRLLSIMEENVQANITMDDILNLRKYYLSSTQNLEQLYFQSGTGQIINKIYYYIPDDVELASIQKQLKEHLEVDE